MGAIGHLLQIKGGISLKSKAFIIGLDGATFDLIKPWVARGELPTLASLLREGCHGYLRTVLPPLTAPAWATMVTGTNPGKHALVDFWARDFQGYGFRLLNASSRAQPALWDIVSQAGGRVIVCNVPMTYPPSPVNGVMVSGMDTPGLDAQYTFPAGLKRELNEAVGRYVITPDDWLYSRRRQFDRARQELLHGVEVHFTAMAYLLEHYPWDLAMVVFTETDGAAHFFWQFMDSKHPLYEPQGAARYGNTILEVYKKVDEKLTALTRSLPEDTTVFVVSDHGNGPVSDRAIHLNAWLEKKELLQYRRVSMRQRWEAWLSQAILRVLRTLRRQIRSQIPYQLQVKLEALVPGGGKRIESSLLSAQIDWARTRAFSEEVRGSIWINLRGRDIHGIVEPGAEYAALVQRILSEVRELRDPVTSEPLIERAYRRQELYHGPYVDWEPDVILEPRGTTLLFRKQETAGRAEPVRLLSRKELMKTDTTGHHLMNGILLICGAGIRANHELIGAHIADVAPTVLYTMGLPIPAWMDGHVLEEAFDPSYWAQHPPRLESAAERSESQPQDTQGAYSEEEAQIVEDRLRGLGYL